MLFLTSALGFTFLRSARRVPPEFRSRPAEAADFAEEISSPDVEIAILDIGGEPDLISVLAAAGGNPAEADRIGAVESLSFAPIDPELDEIWVCLGEGRFRRVAARST